MIILYFSYRLNMEPIICSKSYEVMNDDYLRTIILYNIDDIKDLIYACSIDNKSREICAQRYFWTLYFLKYHLPLPEENYNNVVNWIKIFNKTKIIHIPAELYQRSMDLRRHVSSYPTTDGK